MAPAAISRRSRRSLSPPLPPLKANRKKKPNPKASGGTSFRNFFGGTFEPETGRHYFLFRFYPEPGRLSVAFFRARQNKTGLSSVRQEITLDHILRNPEWCEHSPELPQVVRQIAQYLDYYGHRDGNP